MLSSIPTLNGALFSAYHVLPGFCQSLFLGMGNSDQVTVGQELHGVTSGADLGFIDKKNMNGDIPLFWENSFRWLTCL